MSAPRQPGRKRLKGQSLVFEQVMLFTIGVAILVICVSIFTIYQGYFLGVGETNQLDQATEWVAAHIVEAALTSGSTTATLEIPVPRTVGNAVYQVTLSSQGLVVENLLTGAQSRSTLATLNQTFQLSGTVTSVNGRIIVKKDGNQVILS
ncbi:MAG: hypothetical protein HY369_00805 [Candidatus Aenigmarchaeota archaeon]|nr:hypothetical protein [Candidatus Aenigmarchaeota archaeon]